MDVLFYMIVTLFGSQTSNAKVFSEDDVYITNFTTSYNDIPADCDLFGSEFGENYPVQKLIIDITANGIFWIGAKIGFKRNINPVGVQPQCMSNYNESLDGCNNLCIKGQKYFSYNEHSCTCSNDNQAIRGLSSAKQCETQEQGLCSDNSCVVYERDVLNKDYVCDVYQFSEVSNSFLLTTHNCSEKLSFICAGDKLQPYTINSSWLVADHVCSKKGQHLLQTKTELGKGFNGTKYWIALFRRKRFFWGYDNTKTVCVAARIQANGSYRLESHFCNESLEALCHKPGRTYDSSSDAEVLRASLGILGIVVVCIIVVAAIANGRKRYLTYIQTIQQPLEDCKNGSTTTDGIMNKYIDEPMYSNSDVPLDDSAVYALAKDYSDPSHKIEVQDKQYDSVSYVEPRNTDADKLYDHIMEDPYQNPYS